MPQIQVFNPAPSAGYAFGSGLGQGIANVSSVMINQKLNEMLEQKQLAKQHVVWANQGAQIEKFTGVKGMGALVAALGPENALKIHEQMGSENLSAALAEMDSGGQSIEKGAGRGNISAQGKFEQPKTTTQTLESIYTPQTQGGQYKMSNQAPIATGMQGIGQKQPIEQQEMLQAAQEQASNTEMMKNGYAPNIKGIPARTGQGQVVATPEMVGQTGQAGQAGGQMELPKGTIDMEGNIVEHPKSFEWLQQKMRGLPSKEKKELRNAWQKSKDQWIAAQTLEEKKKKGIREQESHQREMNEIPNKYIENTTDRWQKNFKNMAELKSIEELSKKGDINTFKNRLLTLGGWDTSLFTNPTEDIVQKVTNDLLPGGLSSYSGMGKVMQSEIGAMLKTFPTLVQTPEGRQSIIKLMYTNGEMLNAEYDAMNQLRLQYQGKTKPEDFRGMVLAKAKPLMDAYQEKMHQILSPGSPTLESMKDKVSIKLPDGRTVQIDTVNLGKALEKGASIQ
jgi:actin-related protein